MKNLKILNYRNLFKNVNDMAIETEFMWHLKLNLKCDDEH